MYNLLIVDDELLFCRQMVHVLDWEALGFHISGTFTDAQKALDFITENAVDAILTDIKMPGGPSGIDLAEYINRNYPDISVIIMSGYRSFDYAQAAIRNNVCAYLTKPITYQALYETFTDLKASLDKRQPAYDAQELESLIQRTCLHEILLKAVSSRAQAEEKCLSARLPVRILDFPCFYVRAEFAEFDDFLDKKWKHGRERFYQSLWHFLIPADCGYLCYPLFAEKQAASFLLFSENGALPDLTERAQQYCEILGLRCNIRTTPQYADLFALAEDYEHLAAIDPEYTKNSMETLLSLIHTGKTEAACQAFDLLFQPTEITLQKAQDIARTLLQSVRSFAADKSISYPLLNTDDAKEIHRQLSIFVRETAQQFRDGLGPDGYEHLIEKAQRYIRENYAKDITLKEVAGFVALNPIYLSRFFKQKTGEKFIDYLTRIRMEKAAELLRQPDIKVYEICSRVGYHNVQHFYRLFKLYTGYTPTEYRAQQKE
ncbi:helix-turn-helix domain-containing protein [Ructibacterium gallinarum]|uniref:Stage 0 sporulation protein A homolog n=1 Tax=Ructibacterium gallinarum TaxID=2779355 RepID=A0A9D5R8Z7_9FIRM|nr:helix-turn-helix domain-containing protein [Ructibacterium gallinarum]MBE5040931.1 helix-turn-helix domain-containing protein [Ructibacterium gallinarum]